MGFFCSAGCRHSGSGERAKEPVSLTVEDLIDHRIRRLASRRRARDCVRQQPKRQVAGLQLARGREECAVERRAIIVDQIDPALL